VAAYRLHPHCDVTLYESNSYVGGHTNTVVVPSDEGELAIDTGFIVFNDRTYPHFCALLDELGIASQPTEMSFSVRSDATGLEYCGSNVNGLFAQRGNLLRPTFYQLLYDFFRFGRAAPGVLESTDDRCTVGEFLERERYSKSFIENYFLPMGSAIWSCPRGAFAGFPLRFIMEFYHNHGLLTVRNRPQWRVICGGSQSYVRAMIRSFAERIQCNAPVSRLRRCAAGVEVVVRDGEAKMFDHVVVACHSDQALRMLGDQASRCERELLSEFPYERNLAVLHTDERLLPKSRRAWASWNYHIGADTSDRATVTYNMNILQRLSARKTYCVTLNEPENIAPECVLGQFLYEHPVFTSSRRAAQLRRDELIDHDRISYCGAYWGNGFHEDGVRSALEVCQRLLPIRQSREGRLSVASDDFSPVPTSVVP
jgi:predicted NAD/FAD-binding protein